MQIILDIIVPVFGIVMVGYLAARSGFFSDTANRGLSLFVFNFAIPPMLFRTMATTTLPDPIEWGHVLAYFGGGYAVWGLAMLVSRRGFGRDLLTGALAGMTAAFGNTVLLGIPLILTTYGDIATLPVFLIIAFHSPLFMTTITVLAEASRGQGNRLGPALRNIGRGIVTNPIVMGLLLGIAWNVFQLPLPKLVDVLAETLGRAALPCAVFAMGASLAGYRIAGALPEATVGLLLKLIGHPIAVFLLGTYVFQLDRLWRDVAVIMAALPVGVNVYLFAQRYETGTAPAATAILVSTALSVVTIAVLLFLLDVR